MASVVSPRPLLPGPGSRRRSGRWIAIGVLSLLLHLTALDLLPRFLVDVPDGTANALPLEVRLLPPLQPAPAPAPPPVPAATPIAPLPRPRGAVRPRPALREPDFVPESAEPAIEVSATLLAARGANGSQVEAAAPAATAATTAATTAPAPPEPVPSPPPSAPSPPPPAAVAPQSARLSYRLVRTDGRNAEPMHNYGVGTIDWRILDGRYRSELRTEVKILFARFEVMALHSEGSVGASGLVPDRYTEAVGKRAQVATNFNRDARQSISFSSTQSSTALVAGVQDRLSLLFQVGALLLADPQPFAAGTVVDMPVAGVRGEVETWHFTSRGVESVETGMGPLSTVHLRRTPDPGSNDKTIDVWIARADGGYPARVVYTEPNGTTIEMTLDRVGAID